MPSLHEIAEQARHQLMLCSLALDDATPEPSRDPFEIARTVTAPLRYIRLKQAQKHRARAKRTIQQLHDALHERASLGVRNGELWIRIVRTVDAIALSRWLNTTAMTSADLTPARATVYILLGDLSELLGQLSELEWPGEMA